MKKILSTKYNENTWACALLLIRLIVGFFMLLEGLHKMQNYADTKTFNYLFGAPIDGILVIFAELFCSFLVMIGLFTRVALIPLIIVMCVAFFKVHHGELFAKENGVDAFRYLILYISLLLTGPGKWSIDRLIAK